LNAARLWAALHAMTAAAMQAPVLMASKMAMSRISIAVRRARIYAPTRDNVGCTPTVLRERASAGYVNPQAARMVAKMVTRRMLIAAEATAQLSAPSVRTVPRVPTA